MSIFSKCVVLLGIPVLLVSLVGCSGQALREGVSVSAGHAPTPIVVPISWNRPHPTPTPRPKPVVVAPVVHVASPPPPPTGPASPACVGTPVGVKHLYVSISSQSLSACYGPVLFVSTLVTTGASALTNVHDATPVGTWRIYAKIRNTVLVGHDANGSWRDPVAYWMPFWEGYGFHDASWQTFPYGSSLYTTKGSHGCVHVPVGVLGEIFNWAPVGTLVTIRG